MRLAWLLCLALVGACRRDAESSAVAITGATVIDPRDNSRVVNATILIDSGRVVSVVAGESASVPRGARAIDARGKFVIPGLWDMHVHIQNQQELEVFFPLLIAHGILGIRECQGLLPRELRALGEAAGYAPEVFGAGPGIGGATPRVHSDVGVIVDSLAGQGVDFIKVFSFETPTRLAAIIARAKQRGMGVAGHVSLEVPAGQASDLGLQSMEHAFELHLAVSSREDEFRAKRLAAAKGSLTALEATKLIAFPPVEPLTSSWSDRKAATLFQKLAANHTWQVPTLELFRVWGAALGGDSAFWNDSNLAFVPPAWPESWRPERHKFLDGLTGPDLASVVPGVRAWYNAQLELVRRMHVAGVGFLAGTDASQWNFMVPGVSLHAELAHFVEAGFTPMEALQTATSNPVDYMKKTDTLGTVTAGKRANIVVLDADPALDVRNTSRIFAVVLRGRVLTRDSLDAMLTAARKRASASK